LNSILFGGYYSFEFDLMPIKMTGMSLAKRLNLICAGANLFHRRIRPWSMPLHMQVEITNFCNLRCPVCPTGMGILRRPHRSMDIELFQKLMAEVGPYLLTIALYAWGEPLLHPQLKEMLQIAAKYPTAVLVSTNGQNLDRPGVQEALLAHPPAYLIVAIDGLTDETNSRFRQGARIKPVVEGVKRLAQAKLDRKQTWPILHMRFMIMKHNQHEVPHLQQFARDCGFDLLTSRGLSIIDSAEKTHRDLVPDISEYQAYEYEEERRVRRKDFICMQPFWFPSVFADGTVVGCEQDYNSQQPMGLLGREGNFRNIWASGRARKVRKLIRDKASSLSFCRNCPYADRNLSADNRCSIEAWPLHSETMPAVIPHTNQG
jgi:MoaA/NifB/PqqE/SkfB family radical SAM enzyme